LFHSDRNEEFEGVVVRMRVYSDRKEEFRGVVVSMGCILTGKKNPEILLSE
jgi:hypothetical protein